MTGRQAPPPLVPEGWTVERDSLGAWHLYQQMLEYGWANQEPRARRAFEWAKATGQRPPHEVDGRLVVEAHAISHALSAELELWHRQVGPHPGLVKIEIEDMRRRIAELEALVAQQRPA